MFCWLKRVGLIILIIPKMFQCTSLELEMITQDKSTLSECIMKIVKNIKVRMFKVSILSSEDNDLILTSILKRIYLPVIINAIENRTRGLDTRVYSDLLLIHNFDVKTAVERTIWHRNTKFLVLYDTEKNMMDDFQKFWKLRVMNVFGLVNDSKGIRLFSYLPYERLNCDAIKIVLLDTWNGEEFFGNGLSVINNEIRLKSANGCPVNVSVVHVRPMVLFPEHCKCNGDIDGIEARFIKVFGEVLNFTPTFSKAKDGLGWGRIQPPRGVVGEVYLRESEFGFGLLAPLVERHENIDLSPNFNNKECITFAVPVGAGWEQAPWLRTYMGGLTVAEFFLIFLSLLAVTFIIFISSGLLPISALLYAMMFLFRQTATIPERSILKYLILTWILFSAMITQIYEASLGSRMTIPLQPPDIKTFQQLLQSDLKFCGYPNMLDLLRSDGEMSVLGEIAQRFIATDYDVHVAVEEIRQKKKIAYMSHESNFLYAVLQNANARGYAVPLKECAYEYYPSIAMQKNSPFSNSVDKMIIALFESGIGQHWRSLFINEVPEHAPDVEAIHLEKSFGVFVMLSVGYVIALISFMTELGMGYISKRRHKRNKSRRKIRRKERNLDRKNVRKRFL